MKKKILTETHCMDGTSGIYYQFPKGNKKRGGGSYGLGSIGLPWVNGLLVKWTAEVVGVNLLERPRLEHYVSNYAGDREVARARGYFCSAKRQREFPKARPHMRLILRQRAEAKNQFREALRLWNHFAKLPDSRRIVETR